MSFGHPWGYPFYAGGGTSTLVPDRYHVAIAGRPYMLDTADGPGWFGEDIPVQRAQADTEADPSEATLNTEGLWRRTRLSWHLGGGQEYADRPESNPFRYASSSGVDPWTRYQLTLLGGTTRSLTSANTGLYLAVAAGRLYVIDGQIVRYTTDLVTWTAITGNPAATALSLATDGSTVYVAYGASGVYTIAAGAAAMTSYATGTAGAVGYAKGRLLVLETSAASPRVYNVTASAAITTGNLLLTVPNGVFEPGQWVAEGPSAIYVAGFVGDVSRVWRTAVKNDATALDAPVVAGTLPDGQRVRSVQDYLGTVLLVGTDDHVFLMDYDNAGNLVTRGNFATGTTVYGFEPQGVTEGLGHVWYTRADATLGRMDLATNTSPDPAGFVPANASDLVAALSGAVRSVVTFNGLRVFTVTGRGVYAETAAKVTSGVLDLGTIGFGIGDLKNVLFADIRHRPLTAGQSVLVEVAKDSGPWQTAGSSSEVGSVSATVALGQLLAESVRLRITLTGAVTVTMVTVRAVPAPKVGEIVRLNLLMFRDLSDITGAEAPHMDIPAEREYLANLRSARTAVTVQVGAETFSGVVDRLVRFSATSEARGDDRVWLGYWNGTQTIDIKKVDA